jgi:hypothetical protein
MPQKFYKACLENVIAEALMLKGNFSFNKVGNTTFNMKMLGVNVYSFDSVN